ncbi:choice-of-anchor D domain-containing protein [Hymenobacter sp. ASUV-10]|uniref:Choice-of-anchor D domain-containing protein n=1 Tax=Hymenobacter aranciens TaxID=3063996 RepID=A0ABT9BCX4_9BACT|nr:choice-of-anchor D domain-containing protein [Hymenobacter sp. ASUV-10]MDO7874556.1 choice-of-anchor D domain-containing protein [Hymenobacter sp. ASUV-10]
MQVFYSSFLEIRATLTRLAVLVAAITVGGLLAAPAARAQVPQWQQLIYDQYQPRGATSSTIRATAVDANGDVLVAGIFNFEVTFGTHRLASRANNELFVAKWRPSTSTWLWAIRDGGYNVTDVTGLALNGSSVYVSGTFTSNASSTFAGTALPGAGEADAFLVKYTDTGSTATGVWAVSGGGPVADAGRGVAVSGNSVYLTGSFSGTARFAGTSLVSAGSSDVFLVKYTDNGSSVALGWARRSGGTRIETSGAVAVSGNNVYITGDFVGQASIAGVTLRSTVRTGNIETRDLFLAKYTDAGTTAWVTQVGGTGEEYGHALLVQGSDIYLGGEFASTLTMGSTTLTAAGNQDALLARFSDTGSTATPVWAVRDGGGSADEVKFLALRGNELYSIGTFSPSTQPAPSVAGVALTSAGLLDVYVARYAADTGAGQWARSFGSTFNDEAYAVAPSATDLYIAFNNPSSVVAFGPNQTLLATMNAGVLGRLDPATGAWRDLRTPNKGGRSQVNAIAPDADGNLLVAGLFSGQLALGSTLLTNVGGGGQNDIFLGKWSPAANDWLWAVRGGGLGNDEATGVAVVGNRVYVAGTFASGQGCRIAGTNLPGAGSTDGFVAGYTDNGSSVSEDWAAGLGGSGDDLASSLAASASGVYVTGTYTGSATAAGVALPTSAGSTDIYLAKYTLAGAGGWAVRGGGTGGEWAGAVAANGNQVYLTASFDSQRAASFAGVVLPGAGSFDVVLAKYVDQGSTVADGWAVSAGGRNYERARALAVSGANVYLTGSFSSTFGTTVAGVALTGAGSDDLFVAKYVDQGSTVANGWARSGGGTGSDISTGIAVNGSYVYLSGTFLNGSQGNTATIAGSTITQIGETDVFLARFTDTGSAAADGWAVAGGSDEGQLNGPEGNDYAATVAVVGTNVYLGGQVSVPGGITFTPPLFNAQPPTFGTLTMERGAGSYPYFIARLNDAPEPVITALTPGTSAPGATISIAGTNLNGITSITFTGPSGPLTVTTGFVGNAGGTLLTGVVVPAGALTGPVTVTGAGGTSAGFVLLLPGPRLEVAQGATPYPSGGLAYDFGPVPVGTTSAPVAFTLSNPGSTPLTLTNVSASFDFVLSGAVPATVPAGGTATVSVAYAPTLAGARTGTLTLTSALGAYTVNLSGRGLPNPTVISLSPPVTTVGATVTITGTNFVVGGTTVTLNGVPLTGVSVSLTQGSLTFVVPAGATSGQLVLSTSGGTASAGLLCISYPPTAAAVAGCAGSALTLTASGAPASGGTYQWFATASSTAVLGTGATFTTPPLSAATTYYVAIDFGAAGTGCPNPRTAVPVTLTAVPRPTIAAGGPLSFCAGDSVRLTASGADTYVWSTGATTPSIRVTTGGSYTVTGTSTTTGCAGQSATVAVLVQALPATPTITQAAGGLLSSSAVSGNQWYVGGVLIPGATGVNFQAPANGSYSVTTTSAAGCVSAASAAAVVVLTGTAASSLAEGFGLFPNPAHHAATVLLPAGLGAARLTLLNALGQTVRSVAVSGQQVALDLRGLAPGVYAVQLAAGGQRATRRLVVE